MFRGDLEFRNLEPDGTWLRERIDIGLQKPCIRGIWNPGIYTGMWSRAPDCTRAYTLYGLQKVCILSYIYAQTEAPDIYTGIWSRAPDCTRAYIHRLRPLAFQLFSAPCSSVASESFQSIRSYHEAGQMTTVKKSSISPRLSEMQ